MPNEVDSPSGSANQLATDAPCSGVFATTISGVAGAEAVLKGSSLTSVTATLTAFSDELPAASAATTVKE